MPDELDIKEVAACWREQPEEGRTVKSTQFAGRRAGELIRNTRSEILTSITAALFFAIVMAWRLPPARDAVQQLTFAAILAWAAASLWAMRKRIWPTEPRPDALAASGLEHYRAQLAARRDHLRSVWVWHGPLLLAALFFLVRFARDGFPPGERMREAIPLVLVLLGWTCFSIWRRLRAARQIQQELDALEGSEHER
jgi:hypothetical protein